MEEIMRVLSKIELSRMTRLELLALLRQAATDFPGEFKEGRRWNEATVAVGEVPALRPKVEDRCTAWPCWSEGKRHRHQFNLVARGSHLPGGKQAPTRALQPKNTGHPVNAVIFRLAPKMPPTKCPGCKSARGAK
jgi:hypothetical protein